MTDPTDPCDYNSANITLTQGGDWNSADCDGDGVTNGREITDGTDPDAPCDYTETSITLTQGGDWNTADCNMNGIINSEELMFEPSNEGESEPEIVELPLLPDTSKWLYLFLISLLGSWLLYFRTGSVAGA